MAIEPLRERWESYEPRAEKPAAGSTWIWEPNKPHARERVRVVAVTWNGEEWWVRTASRDNGSEHLNDLSRFWEACWPDPDPNLVAVGDTITWSKRPSFQKDLPSGWQNTEARQTRWEMVEPGLWKRVG